MLELDGIILQLGDFRLSLDLSLDHGERLAVMGASGSGKSTLLSLIAGFIEPDAGRILVDGQPVQGRAVADRPLSILFQDGNLFPHLSAFDNVALGLSPNLSLNAEDRVRVEEALGRVGLAGFGTRRPGDLSGGQQSRLAIARMLLRDRPLALLDEPFAALDPGLRREMSALLKDLCTETGLTLVMVSHDLRDVCDLCDRLLVLEDGAAVLDASMAATCRNPPDLLQPWL